VLLTVSTTFGVTFSTTFGVTYSQYYSRCYLESSLLVSGERANLARLLFVIAICHIAICDGESMYSLKA